MAKIKEFNIMKKAINYQGMSDKAIECCARFQYYEKNKLLYDDMEINPNGLILITGNSGSGKSTLLNEIAKEYGYRETIRVTDVEKRVIDLLKCSLDETISLLSKAGLSEVPLFLTKYKDLSTGQKYRFDILYSIVNGCNKIVLDEFCAYLDTITAQTCAYNFQKLFRNNNISVIAATCRTDLNNFFLADSNYHIEESTIIKKRIGFNGNPFINDIQIKNGNYHDYIQFEKYHYAYDIDEEFYNEHKGTIHTIYWKDIKIGIIMYISPYDNIEAESVPEFHCINEKISCIYRIILSPCFRGLGLTKMILKESAKHVQQEFIYIFSAMAIYNKFVSRAGYIKIKPVDYRNEYEYRIVTEFERYKRKMTQEEILKAEIKLLAKIQYMWYARYCEIICKEMIFDFNSFFEYYDGAFDLTQIDALREEMKYMEMGHYYIKNNTYEEK